ncbi:hypothetical protein FRC10_003916 [Ceratobasidium sp. 414]|nr:hypothetical protein FRC10_003916 [Ceratobasidium sp. 414]
MSRQRSSIFRHITSRPDPGAHPALCAYRQQLARPLVSNPFEANERVGAGIEAPGFPSLNDEPDQLDNEKTIEEPKEVEGIKNEYKNLDVTWGEQAPEWLNLRPPAKDQISSTTLLGRPLLLTSHPLTPLYRGWYDVMTYAVFFTMAWWMWASQVFYIIDFYTDDWCVVKLSWLDLSTYITHSPGSDTWSSDSIETMSPTVYLATTLDRQMFERIALVVALSRIASKSRRCPRRLFIVPASLLISTGLFFAAYALTKLYGEKKTYAIAKLALWLGGVLVEVVAHVFRFQRDVGSELRLKSHGSIVNRFTAATTIIVGEGINAIAGTLNGIEKAPGFKKDMVVGSICSALIVFFLVYLYFQGSAQLKPVRRRAVWALLHMPWLLCVILLLQSIKNQIVLTNFLNSAGYILDQNNAILSSDIDGRQFNESFAETLLQAGMTLDGQYNNLDSLLDQNATATNINDPSRDALDEMLGVWYLRLQMQGVLNIYLGLRTNDTISDEVQKNITRYQNDYNFTFQIIWGLMKPSVNNTRYIMGLSGGTFILLAALNIVQSLPRDWYQWFSIISRLIVGTIVALLSLLNIGKYQTYFTPGNIPDSERAGIFDLIDKGQVLEILAGAYVFQFAVDTVLIYAAWRVSRKHTAVIGEAAKGCKAA